MKQKMDNKTSGCQFTVAAGRNPSVFVLLSFFCFVALLACVPIQNNSLKEPEVRMVKFTWCEHPMDETTKKKCERVPLMPEPYVKRFEAFGKIVYGFCENNFLLKNNDEFLSCLSNDQYVYTFFDPEIMTAILNKRIDLKEAITIQKQRTFNELTRPEIEPSEQPFGFTCETSQIFDTAVTDCY